MESHRIYLLAANINRIHLPVLGYRSDRCNGSARLPIDGTRGQVDMLRKVPEDVLPGLQQVIDEFQHDLLVVQSGIKRRARFQTGDPREDFSHRLAIFGFNTFNALRGQDIRVFFHDQRPKPILWDLIPTRVLLRPRGGVVTRAVFVLLLAITEAGPLNDLAGQGNFLRVLQQVVHELDECPVILQGFQLAQIIALPVVVNPQFFFKFDTTFSRRVSGAVRGAIPTM